MAFDYGRFEGTMPYASELVGVYQPLLGWKSRHGRRRFSIDHRRLLNRAIVDIAAKAPSRAEILRLPRPIGPDDLMPERLVEALDGRVAGRVRVAARRFMARNNRQPAGSEEWAAVLADANLAEGIAEAGNPRRAKLRYRVTVKQEAAAAGAFEHLAATAPHTLGDLLRLENATALLLRAATDPLAHFDPRTQQAVLSPVGLVTLYRQYFFEFDTFLGPPVGHVWVSPGGLVELYEVHTRRTREERETEISVMTVTKSETEVTEEDELASAVSSENSRNIGMGVTVDASVNVSVVEASASANLSMESTHKQAQEQTHKHTRRQSERLSNEIRRSFKTVFRTAVETEDTSSRRHLLQNTTDKLLNYELKRKMRQVGVQVQHIGTQLCWQVFVDEPGLPLGVSSLVHVAADPDLSSLQPPEAPVKQAPKTEQYAFEFPFEALDEEATIDGKNEDYLQGHDVEEDAGEGLIRWKKTVHVNPPSAGYTLASVTMVSVAGSQAEGSPSVNADFTTQPDKTSFLCQLNSVNFDDNSGLRFTVDLHWDPPDISAEALQAYQDKQKDYDEAETKAFRDAYVTTLRERIRLASEVTLRPEKDLRHEERTVIYRNLIAQLFGAVDQKTSPHLVSELIRALFDVDKMLYFVAPEWWMPRQREGQHFGDQTTLTEADSANWGGAKAPGRPNYLITEESQPARLGASLGWLIQLDGDSHRNAFLNSPWVKAVIPIRPGKEDAALNWLRAAHVEGTEGLDAAYAGPEPDLQGKTIEQALRTLAKQVGNAVTDIKNTLATEQVYENGFDPLEDGFRVDGVPFEVFDQWVEVLPTEQVVAVEYQTGP